jgi:hypothetical protein
MGENTVTTVSEDGSIPAIDTEYTCNVTVDINSLQLLYDGMPADQARIPVDGVNILIKFNLNAQDYDFTEALPSTPKLQIVPPISAKSIEVISSLGQNCSGTVIFTVNGTPTIPPSGPEVTNTGAGFNPSPKR